MTTLVEAFLERGECLEPGDKRSVEVYRWTRAVLRQKTSVLEARASPERFSFDHDPPKIVAELTRAGSLSVNTVLETSRPVCDPMWMEWPNEWTDDNGMARIGALVCSGRAVGSAGFDDRTMITMVTETKERRCASFLTMSVGKFPLKPDNGGHLLHYMPQEDHDVARMFLIDVACCLFMLCTPRVCEEVRVGASRQERRHRERHGLPPVVEYRKVHMRVGAAPVRYASSGGQREETREEAHRRLHKVMGHFRTYEKGREVPRVSFVPEHWRGDAELGIVLHDREVET